MIYTVTLNPALDYIVRLDELKKGYVNRSTQEDIQYGGKGINVSYVLNQLGIETQCLGFIAGFTGQELKRGVKEVLELNEDFIHVRNGMTRINVKVKTDDETEINGSGPYIASEEFNLLLYQLERINSNDLLVLSGSIPKGLDHYVYCSIMEYIKHKGVKVIIDGSGQLLLNSLSYKPFLVKPNHHELADLYQVELNTIEDIQYYAMKLKEQGAQNVLVSMGKDGSLLIDEYNNIYYREACKGETINTVGCGDSMVAGFIAGIVRGYDYSDSLKLATACGGATAFSPVLAKSNEIEELLLKM